MSLHYDFVENIRKLPKIGYLSKLQIENIKARIMGRFKEPLFRLLNFWIFEALNFKGFLFLKIMKFKTYKTFKANGLRFRKLGKDQTHTKFQKDLLSLTFIADFIAFIAPYIGKGTTSFFTSEV